MEDAHNGGKSRVIGRLSNRLRSFREGVRGSICLLDSRIRTMTAEPEEGAATAEYAVVLVAATGFAALLVALLKSDVVKSLLTELVKKALKV